MCLFKFQGPKVTNKRHINVYFVILIHSEAIVTSSHIITFKDQNDCLIKMHLNQTFLSNSIQTSMAKTNHHTSLHLQKALCHLSRHHCIRLLACLACDNCYFIFLLPLLYIITQISVVVTCMMSIIPELIKWTPHALS
jgi:hypothetical protein